jgi:hypothetical protein
MINSHEIVEGVEVVEEVEGIPIPLIVSHGKIENKSQNVITFFWVSL